MKSLAAWLVIACLAHATELSFETRKRSVRGLIGKGEFEAALTQARTIVKEWPDDVASYQLVAEAGLGLGNYPEAETALQWMIDLRIGKTDAHGWLLVARFREATGDIDGAIEAVSQSFSRAAPMAEDEKAGLAAYAGHLYFAAGRIASAEQVLKAAGDRPDGRLTLAHIRLAQGKREEAVDLMRKIVSQCKQPRYLYELARLTGSKSDYENFEQAAREIADLPQNANRELVLYLSGPGAQAAEALKIAKLEAVRRHDIYTQDALAVAYYAVDDLARARAVMNETLAVGTRDPEIVAHARKIGVSFE